MALADGLCPLATYKPGVDSAENDARRQGVRVGIVHTTEGVGDGLIALGATRHHNTPGTFNFLVMQDGRLYQFYPADVRCSHAAGANHAGPGIEHEGFTGQPRPAAQLATLGRLARWLHDEWGVPLTYRTGDPRIWLDNTADRGFFAHRKVDYPPDTSLRHFDQITTAEWATALGTQPSTQESDPDMWILKGKDGPLAGQHHAVDKDGIDPRTMTPQEAYVHALGGVKVLELAQTNGYEVLPVATKAGATAPSTLNVTLSGTAKPA